MAREAKDDFAELRAFVSSYSVRDHLEDENFVNLLSRLHKRYYALLILNSELAHQSVQVRTPDDPFSNAASEIFARRLAESLSDMGSALFVWVHGAYKAARFCVRSGIENFFKTVAITHSDGVETLKSTWELIDVTRQMPFFGDDEFNRSFFGVLSETYSELCRDVHTATVNEMEQLSSLGHFPAFDHADAQAFTALFTRVADAIVSIVCLMFPRMYWAMHHRNRDLLQITFADEVRRRLTAER
jgi:hypothetical protein